MALKCALIHPLSAPMPIEIEDGASWTVDRSGKVWAACQRLVAAPGMVGQTLIEPVELTEPDELDWHLEAYVNEEGLILQLPRTCILSTCNGPVDLYGPVVVLRVRLTARGNCEYANLTEQDWKTLREMHRSPIPFLAPVT